ncbi:hypothetical protein [Jiella pelagia]|uniref:Uncharacterized protein n=1 Tax=Jiella pelagia TaxID=2986949 RepID=A0ABY7BVX7_9HYPH|nr:hypothetical protein [Jiella pelagia]WAP67215.1 hypothetical protein OH818_16695 [Jiella pelagia]
MNPRILKKMSARAAPLLPLLGDRREQFRAKAHENYHGVFMPERKHWERHRCHPSYEPTNRWTTPRGAPLLYVTRAGQHMVMYPPQHPLAGTVMVGGISGYYEPEWDEQTAYEALSEAIFWRFFTHDPETETEGCSRDLSTPAAVFAAAAEVLAGISGVPAP